MRERTFINDTAPIEARLYGEDGVNTLPATEVSWKIKKPQGQTITGGPTPITETEATILFTGTDQPGPYSSQITFTLGDGTKRSTVLSFEVVDPLEVSGEATTDVDKVVDRAWMKIEDLFDSELGGPHVRDRTMANFDREKLKRLLPDALYYINNYYQPATGFDETNFPYTGHSSLLSQALLVEGIYHLIRSYVEQWGVAKTTPGYFDRRDYLQRWQSVLQGEEKKLLMFLDLFKRDQMGLGSTSVLIGGYAGFPVRYPRYMRGRYPYIFRF